MMDQNRIKLTLTVNGVQREAEIDTRMLLVEALRDVFEVTGPKVGCATGDCGACTVSIDGVITKSCLKLAVASDDAEIVTIEGLEGADGLTPVQRAFWEAHGFQCGFCLSGMLFAAHDLLTHNPSPTEDDIRWAIGGNVCRCTGYQNVVAAVAAAAGSSQVPAAIRSVADGTEPAR
jgi:aerobic-type carbon monoxide dehydrogenase small subunit (CoxS/CutS family)